MAPPTAFYASKKLSAYLQYFQDVFRRSFAQYKEYDPKLRLQHSKRSRASILSDLFELFARQVFENVHGVVLRKIRGLFLVEVDQFLIRFKKLDSAATASNISTVQTQLFYGQQFPQLDLNLPGIPPPTSLVAGYQLDPLEQDMSGCIMVCPMGLKKNSWTFPIEPDTGQTSLEDVVTLTPPKPPSQKVRAKPFAKKKRTRRNDAS